MLQLVVDEDKSKRQAQLGPISPTSSSPVRAAPGDRPIGTIFLPQNDHSTPAQLNVIPYQVNTQYLTNLPQIL